MRDYCKDQIAHYKIPKYWLWTQAFPLTVTGKPLKYILQADANQKLFPATNEKETQI